MIGKLKSNWRLTMLVVIVLLSLFVLFSPTMAPQVETGGENATASEGITNLQYGLDLAGGTRIRAPLLGITAENVAFGGDSEGAVSAAVAAELPDTEPTDVIARQQPGDESNTVEMVNPDVDAEAFADALAAAGYEHGEIRDGLTQTTREEAIDVIEGKVNQAGLSGASVQQVTDGTGFFILIEVPGENRQDVISLLEERGSVRIDIYHQNDAGEYVTREAALTRDDFDSISSAQQGTEGPGPHVPVTVRQDSNIATDFQSAVVETGVAQSGGSQCRYFEAPQNTDACLLLVVDDEVVNAFGMNPDLARSMQQGSWAADSSFILTTTSYEEAQEIAINLRAGALPATLGISEGTTSFISPTQGENFRVNALVVGILSVLTVSGVVFARYREPNVALPMILTAFSEVLILLGVAAYLGYPLDLAVIAGFIAVIGTGVDDLIIIADEVMSEGEVSSQRVFDSRFKRAFWVIGVAAGTTIIAMSPLAVLSLGDLRGFAIFTILGVIVGVAITRPAYGDILRHLLTDR